MYSDKYAPEIYKSKIDKFYEIYFNTINPKNQKYKLSDSNKKILDKFIIHSKHIKKMDTIHDKISNHIRNSFFLIEAKTSELILFEMDATINSLRMKSEILYYINKNILFQEIIDNGKIDKKKLCNLLCYNDDEIQDFYEIFFIKFRNAMSHSDYDYKFDDEKFEYFIWDYKYPQKFSIIDIDTMSDNMLYLIEKMKKMLLYYYF